jgi:hypothetical protein
MAILNALPERVRRAIARFPPTIDPVGGNLDRVGADRYLTRSAGSQPCPEKDTAVLNRRVSGMRTKTKNLLPKTLPGAVCAQMIRCGKTSCKCARGELHGPYFYHFARVDHTVVKRYVRKADVDRSRAACGAHREVERAHRQTHMLNRRELARLREQLRGNERFLLQFFEMNER